MQLKLIFKQISTFLVKMINIAFDKNENNWKQGKNYKVIIVLLIAIKVISTSILLLLIS